MRIFIVSVFHHTKVPLKNYSDFKIKTLVKGYVKNFNIKQASNRRKKFKSNACKYNEFRIITYTRTSITSMKYGT